MAFMSVSKTLNFSALVIADIILQSPDYKGMLSCPVLNHLIMTKSLILTLSGSLDCFVPRNDGDLCRHHSFLQGIYPMPGTYNDEFV